MFHFTCHLPGYYVYLDNASLWLELIEAIGSQTRQHSSLDEQTQSHQCFQYIGHTNFNALSNAVTSFLSISINGYHTAKNDLGTIVYKRPTFAFSPEIGTLGFWRKIAHSSSHGETGGLPSLGHSVVCTTGEIVTERTAGESGCTPHGVCPLPPAPRPR